MKMEGGLRLCVQYRAQNQATVKNWYPLTRISVMPKCVHKARIFTTLDLCSAYYVIRIKEADEKKTPIGTHYGQFEYQVMAF
jgi:hypothetical protein